MQEATAGTRTVFFVDASHVVLAPFLGFIWSFARVFLRAPRGRQRFKVLGALQAVTHQLLTVTNDPSSTAESVCALRAKIAQPGGAVPITLVLDHASYQRCAKVTACAADLGIELLFLPPYSPNLNLIERLPYLALMKLTTATLGDITDLSRMVAHLTAMQVRQIEETVDHFAPARLELLVDVLQTVASRTKYRPPIAT